MRIYLFLFFLIFIGCDVSVDCDQVQKEIIDLVKEYNYCSLDSDCIVQYLPHCIGCYSLVNKDIEESDIESLIKDYNYNCPECLVFCERPLEYGCREGKCVDLI